jgi:hypothetical protein
MHITSLYLILKQGLFLSKFSSVIALIESESVFSPYNREEPTRNRSKQPWTDGDQKKTRGRLSKPEVNRLQKNN